MGQPLQQKKEQLLNFLHDFAIKHRDTPHAGDALMSFLRGECHHLSDEKGKCKLCGVKVN